MNRLTSFLLAAACFAFSQSQPVPRTLPGDTPPGVETKLPNGRSQREEIIKDDYKKNLEEAAALAKLAEELKSDLEKGDKNIVSVKNIKQTEEIEKLARSIRNRLKRY